MHAPLLLACPLALLALPARQEVAERAVDPASGHTYVRTAEPLSFYDADALARVVGATLVAIGSAEEETFLLDNFGASEGYWTGLEFPRETWSSGERVAYAHWFKGEPGGGALEPFTVLNWGEPGAWGDCDGDVEKERYRALLEFPRGPVPEALPAPPVVRHDDRGVLLLVVQDLQPKDLENPRLPSLGELWKRSAWTLDAAADGSGDPLASLGLLVWGVGSAKSRLASSAPENAARYTNENLLVRLERAHPRITTASLLDDVPASGLLMDGRVDLRVSNASARKGGHAAPWEDALARPTPLCLVAAWTALPWEGSATPGDGERARELAAIDKELGSVLAALRARPGFAEEEWWIALAGLTPPRERSTARKPTPEDLRARTGVPLALVTSARAPGELLGEVGLADVLPSALVHLGIEPRRSFGLDGRALALARAPALGEDLVVNGGAEAQYGYLPSEHVLVTGWRQLGGFRVARHPPAASLPGDPGPEVRGQGFLQGAAEARLEQTLDVSSFAAEIDRDALRFRLAAWLGLLEPSTATIELAVEPLNERKKPLGRTVLALPEPAKKDAGVRAAGWTKLEGSARLPRRTRALRLALTATGPDTSADGIQLRLEPD